MEFVTIFFTALGGTGTCLLVAAFLGRKFISHQLNKNLIFYEKELEAKTEVLKNNLSIFAHEQTVGISRIDSQRSDAIKSIYSAITKWSLELNELNFPRTEGFSTEHEMLEFFNNLKLKINRSNEEIIKSLIDNAIYISSQFYDQLAEFTKFTSVYSIKIGKIIDQVLDSGSHNKAEHISEKLKHEKTQFDSAFDPIRGRLVDEFRRLMKA